MDQWIIRQEIDFSRPPERTGKERPLLLMLPGDNLAHSWEIACFNNGEPADMTEAIVDGYFQRADGVVVHVSGTHSDNICNVLLSVDCYAVPGGMRGVVKVSHSGRIVTIADRPFWVQPDLNATAIDSSDTIPSITELMAQVAMLRQLNNITMVTLMLNGITALHVVDGALVYDKIPVTDENAYDVAVSMGYTGTEEEWNAYVAAVANNTALINQAVTAAENAETIAETAAQAKSTAITVQTSDWTQSGDYYVARVACAAAKADNTLIIGPGPMTEEQLETMEAAKISPTAQEAGYITLTCYGEVPEMALPINVLGVDE